MGGLMEEMVVVGWGREREGPAQGPGLQMTPVCRPNVPVGFCWLLILGTKMLVRVFKLVELRFPLKSLFHAGTEADNATSGSATID